MNSVTKHGSKLTALDIEEERVWQKFMESEARSYQRDVASDKMEARKRQQEMREFLTKQMEDRRRAE